MSTLVERCRELVAEIVAGRRCILATGPVAGMAGTVKLLRELGATDFLLLADSQGTGAAPEPPVEAYIVGRESSDMMTGIRNHAAGLRDLPPEAAAAVERFDPDRTACVFVSFVIDVSEIAGRPVYAPRLPEWLPLEDKSVIDAVWDDLGVARAPSRVVAANAAALGEAAAQLDPTGEGTVWSGDSREGFNGGASYVRWVRTAEHAREASDFFSAHCDRVRVAPFLEGIPCSIHGLVFAGGEVATFRPCEMVVLRRTRQAEFLYAGASTFWDPPAADREALRELARRVGAGLHARVGYRGPFTIGGVLTANGFRPTELNARFGAAMGLLGRGLTELPLFLLTERIKRGDPTVDPEALERRLVENADNNRGGGGWTIVPGARTETEVHDIVYEDGRYRLAAEGEAASGTLTLGPASAGTWVRFSPDTAQLPEGEPVAPRVVAAFALAEAEFGCPFGPLEAAREMC